VELHIKLIPSSASVELTLASGTYMSANQQEQQLQGVQHHLPLLNCNGALYLYLQPSRFSFGTLVCQELRHITCSNVSKDVNAKEVHVSCWTPSGHGALCKFTSISALYVDQSPEDISMDRTASTDYIFDLTALTGLSLRLLETVEDPDKPRPWKVPPGCRHVVKLAQPEAGED
jgi:hypothetical protein